MTLPTAEMTKRWLHLLHELREQAADFSTTLANVESSFASAAISFYEIVTEFAEYAVNDGLGQEFAEEMQRSADLCEATTFRFLAAWCYLNISNFDACIDECEKVAHPYAPVYTIHGQALLESGLVAEAIQILEIAVKISPNEILAHFQLAKAYHILESFPQAWKSIEICQRLAPQALEVATMAALCCLTLSGAQPQHLRNTHSFIRKCLTVPTTDIESLKYMLEIVFQLEDEALMQETLHLFDLGTLLSQPEFMQLLPRILKRLHTNNWNKCSAELLTQLTSSKNKVA
jgi:tetratricopeptide (TPR) repeat protein